jgi:hypothetical protein
MPPTFPWAFLAAQRRHDPTHALARLEFGTRWIRSRIVQNVYTSYVPLFEDLETLVRHAYDAHGEDLAICATQFAQAIADFLNDPRNKHEFLTAFVRVAEQLEVEARREQGTV